MPPCRPLPPTRSRPHERGTALVIVLVLILAMAMLALSAMALSSSDAVHTLSYSADRNFRTGIETALSIGKSRLTHDTTIVLPDSGFVTLMSAAHAHDADGMPLRGITVDVYAGLSRAPSEQDGTFVSVVAEARDARGRTRLVRRLELRAESVASLAMRAPAPAPALLRLPRLSALHDRANQGNTDILTPDTSLTSPRMRIEFVAIDVNDDGDVFDAEEGFFRVFQPNIPDSARAAIEDRCGDWHDVLPGAGVLLEFFPLTVHDDEWFVARGLAHPSHESAVASSGARCFPAGDPHLVAVERIGMAGYAPADWQKGGSDTTFTPIGTSGRWMPFPSAAPEILSAIPTVRQAAEAPYLWPLDPTLNPTSNGVIHVHGPVSLSGVLRGRVTLYSLGGVELVGDLTYAQDSTASCANLLGLITDGDAKFSSSLARFHGLLLSRPDPTSSRYTVTRAVDECLHTHAPPHFPTTGRFTDDRIHEVDPARFDPAALFQRLQAGP